MHSCSHQCHACCCSINSNMLATACHALLQQSPHEQHRVALGNGQHQPGAAHPTPQRRKRARPAAQLYPPVLTPAAGRQQGLPLAAASAEPPRPGKRRNKKSQEGSAPGFDQTMVTLQVTPCLSAVPWVAARGSWSGSSMPWLHSVSESTLPVYRTRIASFARIDY